MVGLSPRYTAVELKRRVEKLIEKPSEKPEPKVESLELEAVKGVVLSVPAIHIQVLKDIASQVRQYGVIAIMV
ncbi:MAG: hypothetical protein J5U17_02450 [Candidatus Methanoperedens sp.]|nr:hypothetical protein [Candidatus Methanoperedens sp.]MCE8428244.1 hypothetical protein [Candidatus Methanoperedens sp.]